MARRRWSVQDAKKRFSDLIEAARSAPQTVTKRGKPAVVILSADEYARLRGTQRLKPPSFAEMLLAIPRGDLDIERIKSQPHDVESR
jgi:antitoxin Phd